MAAGGRAAPEPPPPPGGPGAGAEVFAYTPADFVRQGAAWAGGGGAPSPFDVALQRGWADRVARGLFRYRLGELRTRLLPGPAGFVAQLNPRRGWDRRPPQEARSVRQPFDPRRFNFTRLRPGEVLFALAPRHRPRGPPPVLVAINVSPLEQGHVLLLPEPGRGLPQVLTAEALLAGLEALLLSGRAAFRLGFNSLGAGASVNHLHLHAYYLARELRVETAPCRPLRPAAGLHLLHGVPAPGLLFYCPAGGDGLEQLARRVCRLTDHLARHEVAHNLFATRGAAPEGGEEEGAAAAGARPGVRVILWPRRVSFGAKDGAAFNVALCELAGHLPLKTAADFEALTEDSARRLIQAQLLPDDRFAQLQRELVALLEGVTPPPPPPPPDVRAREEPLPARRRPPPPSAQRAAKPQLWREAGPTPPLLCPQNRVFFGGGASQATVPPWCLQRPGPGVPGLPPPPGGHRRRLSSKQHYAARGGAKNGGVAGVGNGASTRRSRSLSEPRPSRISGRTV